MNGERRIKQAHFQAYALKRTILNSLKKGQLKRESKLRKNYYKEKITQNGFGFEMLIHAIKELNKPRLRIRNA